nr:VOC family protein [uncultured Amphritea sp.]
MIVKGFDHFTIRTDKLEETKDFFAQLLDLKMGDRPSFKFNGYWMYLNTRPIFHLVESAISGDDEVAKYLGMRNEGSNDESSSGCIDHLAFRIEGYGSLLEKAELHGWEFFERTVPDVHEHQLFLRDPNDITIELIFHDEEYQQWKNEQTCMFV